MQSIASITGKLLLTLYHMKQHKEVTAKQHGTLKDLVFSGSHNVMSIYENYCRDGTELTLKSDLHYLLRIQKQSETQSASSSSSRLQRNRNSMTIKIPTKNIQKIAGDPNRI